MAKVVVVINQPRDDSPDDLVGYLRHCANLDAELAKGPPLFGDSLTYAIHSSLDELLPGKAICYVTTR